MILDERGEGWVVRQGGAKEERWAVVMDPHSDASVIPQRGIG